MTFRDRYDIIISERKRKRESTMKSIFLVKISGISVKAICYRRNVCGTTEELKNKWAKRSRKGMLFCVVDSTQEEKFFEKIDSMREERKTKVLKQLQKKIAGYPYEFDAYLYVKDKLNDAEKQGVFYNEQQTKCLIELAILAAQGK